MNLLDLFVKIGVDDKASGAIANISEGAIARASAMGQAMYDGIKFGVGKMADGVKAIVGGAIEGYGAYEQLTGGMKKLYGDASDTVIKNAQKAYREVGISANKYMENAAGFSASLLNSVGGDAEKAAEIADMAMKDISDNANTFGKYTVDELTQVYQGLAKGQYQTLDNLNLGIAGTKEGVAQLIDKANKLKKANGEAADLTADSFADMVEAIHLVQENMNITGTTAKEAMGTIEGSINTTKAAWENLLTAIGAGDPQMVQEAVGGIVSGIFGTWNDETKKREGGIINNLMPVVQNAASAIIDTLPSLASTMAYTLLESFASSILGMDNAGAQEFADVVFEKINDFKAKATTAFGELSTAVQGFFDAFGGNVDLGDANSAIEQLQGVVSGFWGFIQQNVLPNLPAIGEAIGNVVTAVQNFGGSFADTVDWGYINVAIDNIGGIIEDVWGFVEQNILPNMPSIGEALGNIVNFLSSVATTILTVVNNLGPIIPMIGGMAAAVGIVSALSGAFAAISGAVTFFTTVVIPAIGAIQSFGGFIAVLTTVLGGPVTIIAAIVGGLIALIATNEDVRNALLDVWENVKQKFFEVKDAIGQKLTEIGQFFGDLKSGAEEKLNEVIDFFRNLPENIKNALGDLTGTLKQAGLDIIGGFFSGLQDKWNEVSGWVSGIGDWIADHKGPKAYDLGLLVDNGKWIMQSLQTGLEKGLPPVEDTLRDITDSIQTGINTNVGVTATQAPNRDAAILNALGAIRDNMSMSVYLDGNTLVGGIAPRMNTAMGRL